MIKILKQGVLPETIYTGTCYKCACKIECDRYDVNHKPNTWHIQGYNYVMCPTKGCGDEIRVNKKDC